MKKLHVGQSAIDVCKTIIGGQPKISKFKFIAHTVSRTNWRQKNKTYTSKLADIQNSFITNPPFRELEIFKNNLSDLESLPSLTENQVWSFCSKVTMLDGAYLNIPMMNFHPLGVSKKESLRYIENAIGTIFGNRQGVLLDSGRYFHYYGNFLLEFNEWLDFLSAFLLTEILVSPRYIGYVLHDGYCPLRVTATQNPIYKPKIPKVVKVI